MTVNIYDNDSSKTTYIHHLVAKHFIPRPEDPNKKIIDHINGDKTNNHHTNMRWVTLMENANNRYDSREATPEVIAQREKVREYHKQNPHKAKEYNQMYRENGGKNATMSKDREKSRITLMKRQQEEEERKKLDEDVKNKEFENNNPDFCKQFNEDAVKRKENQLKKQESSDVLRLFQNNNTSYHLFDRLKGNRFFKAKQYERAYELYMDALKESPYDSKTTLNIAQVTL
jgi:hypothetical protein